jgi:hypothetical protein
LDAYDARIHGLTRDKLRYTPFRAVRASFPGERLR